MGKRIIGSTFRKIGQKNIKSKKPGLPTKTRPFSVNEIMAYIGKGIYVHPNMFPPRISFKLKQMNEANLKKLKEKNKKK